MTRATAQRRPNWTASVADGSSQTVSSVFVGLPSSRSPSRRDDEHPWVGATPCDPSKWIPLSSLTATYGVVDG